MKTKICGITTVSDALMAAAAGADFLGLNFSASSPRCVTPEGARAIVATVRPSWPGLIVVGVFVNTPAEEAAQVLGFCGLDAAQLHGEEAPEDLGLGPGGASPLRGRAYKAIRPRGPEEALRLAERYALPPALRGDRLPALLLDAYHPALRGGTGRTADVAVAGELAKRWPLMLAGGLTPANVGQAGREIAPWAVDVASGVEDEPGRKSPEAVHAFVRAAREERGRR
jgi:phosphoribosylanthranilate isomerase